MKERNEHIEQSNQEFVGHLEKAYGEVRELKQQVANRDEVISGLFKRRDQLAGECEEWERIYKQMEVERDEFKAKFERAHAEILRHRKTFVELRDNFSEDKENVATMESLIRQLDQRYPEAKEPVKEKQYTAEFVEDVKLATGRPTDKVHCFRLAGTKREIFEALKKEMES